jgi:DNA-directed RNA polymerase subunit RPC12/RpoP
MCPYCGSERIMIVGTGPMLNLCRDCGRTFHQEDPEPPEPEEPTPSCGICGMSLGIDDSICPYCGSSVVCWN